MQIEAELDGNLYIENPLQYPKEQLQFLPECKQTSTGDLILANYVFQYALPVKLFDRDHRQVVDTVVTGSIVHDGCCHYTWSVLSARSSASDVEGGILQLREMLRPHYALMICCCCKYGQEHPYGGDAYLNYLCFRNSKAAYQRLGTVGKEDWRFFSDGHNVLTTRPLYDCEAFSEK